MHASTANPFVYLTALSLGGGWGLGTCSDLELVPILVGLGFELDYCMC